MKSEYEVARLIRRGFRTDNETARECGLKVTNWFDHRMQKLGWGYARSISEELFKKELGINKAIKELLHIKGEMLDIDIIKQPGGGFIAVGVSNDIINQLIISAVYDITTIYGTSRGVSKKFKIDIGV